MSGVNNREHRLKVGRTREVLKWKESQVASGSDKSFSSPRKIFHKLLGEDLCLSWLKIYCLSPAYHGTPFLLGFACKTSVPEKKCLSISWSTNMVEWSWPPANNNMKTEYFALTKGSVHARTSHRILGSANVRGEAWKSRLIFFHPRLRNRMRNFFFLNR